MFQESRIRPLALLFCKEITRYGQKQGYSAIQHLPRYNQCVSNHFLFCEVAANVWIAMTIKTATPRRKSNQLSLSFISPSPS